jgi:hypothetical protein
MTTLPHGSDLPRACVECDQPCRYLTCVDCGEGAYVSDLEASLNGSRWITMLR